MIGLNTSLTALNFRLYGDDYPYDGAALRRLPESKAAREVERLGFSSLDAAAPDEPTWCNSKCSIGNARSSPTSAPSGSGRDLSDVHVTHVFIDSPNALTLFDPNDRSYAIGIDPGFWHAITFLYLDAALGQRVNDPRWFLVLATKTVQWIWIGSKKDWTQDLDDMVEFVQTSAPDIWRLARDVLNTAIAFTIAHEVGHIVLDHLDGPHATDLRLTDRRPAIRASAMDSKDPELEADAWAADALLRVGRRRLQAANAGGQRARAVLLPDGACLGDARAGDQRDSPRHRRHAPIGHGPRSGHAHPCSRPRERSVGAVRRAQALCGTRVLGERTARAAHARRDALGARVASRPRSGVANGDADADLPRLWTAVRLLAAVCQVPRARGDEGLRPCTLPERARAHLRACRPRAN